MEDPDLCGGPAKCRCVHAQRVPEGAEPQPRAARVCPLHSPSHSHKGLSRFRLKSALQALLQTNACFCSVSRGETATRPSSTTPTWTLFPMATRVTTTEAAPLQTSERDHVSLSTGPQIHFLCLLCWCIYLPPLHGVAWTNPPASFNKTSSWTE